MNSTELTVSVPLNLAELIELKVTLKSAIDRWRELGCDYTAGTVADILVKIQDANERFYKQLEEV